VPRDTIFAVGGINRHIDVEHAHGGAGVGGKHPGQSHLLHHDGALVLPGNRFGTAAPLMATCQVRPALMDVSTFTVEPGAGVLACQEMRLETTGPPLIGLGLRPGCL